MESNAREKSSQEKDDSSDSFDNARELLATFYGLFGESPRATGSRSPLESPRGCTSVGDSHNHTLSSDSFRRSANSPNTGIHSMTSSNLWIPGLSPRTPRSLRTTLCGTSELDDRMNQISMSNTEEATNHWEAANRRPSTSASTAQIMPRKKKTREPHGRVHPPNNTIDPVVSPSQLGEDSDFNDDIIMQLLLEDDLCTSQLIARNICSSSSHRHRHRHSNDHNRESIVSTRRPVPPLQPIVVSSNAELRRRTNDDRNRARANAPQERQQQSQQTDSTELRSSLSLIGRQLVIDRNRAAVDPVQAALISAAQFNENISATLRRSRSIRAQMDSEINSNNSTSLRSSLSLIATLAEGALKRTGSQQTVEDNNPEFRHNHSDARNRSSNPTGSFPMQSQETVVNGNTELRSSLSLIGTLAENALNSAGMNLTRETQMQDQQTGDNINAPFQSCHSQIGTQTGNDRNRSGINTTQRQDIDLMSDTALRSSLSLIGTLAENALNASGSNLQPHQTNEDINTTLRNGHSLVCPQSDNHRNRININSPPRLSMQSQETNANSDSEICDVLPFRRVERKQMERPHTSRRSNSKERFRNARVHRDNLRAQRLENDPVISWFEQTRSRLISLQPIEEQGNTSMQCRQPLPTTNSDIDRNRSCAQQMSPQRANGNRSTKLRGCFSMLAPHCDNGKKACSNPNRRRQTPSFPIYDNGNSSLRSSQPLMGRQSEFSRDRRRHLTIQDMQAMLNTPPNSSRTQVESEPEEPICEECSSSTRFEVDDDQIKDADTENPDKVKQNDDDGSIRCAVCMGNPTENRPTSTKCGHVFCALCINEVVNRSRKCPTCNTMLTPQMLFRIYI